MGERIGPVDLSADVRSVIERARPYSLTSTERMASLCEAASYVVRNGIPGAFVECGVWKGGSAMAMALMLQLERDERELYLYDTFQGMSRPTEQDVDFEGTAALEHWPEDESFAWGAVSVDSVRDVMLQTGYPADRMTLVQGKVEDTIPGEAPEQIALLRLDTDWYESTLHELEHLYPRLAPGGILIIDDYGHHLGARKAVDEYFAGDRIFLHRIDYTGRIAVKQPRYA